jgi:FtsX-like permease family protein
MRPLTVARLALAGSRTDTLRVVFTAVSSALAAVTLLAAATVAAVPELGWSLDGSAVWNPYGADLVAQPGLRPGVVATLLLVALPILALAGQSIRFGSPARDRRLSAIRLAGATPKQAMLIATAETGASALLGSLAGLGAYLVLRSVLDRREPDGRLWLPTDVLPPVLTIVLILLVVPVLAALAGAFLLRKVIITPLGVVRRTRARTPSLLPGVLIILGVFSPFVIRPFGGWLARRFGHDIGVTALYAIGTLLILAAILGVVVGTGWISHTTGRLLQRYGRRPAMLLAGRQLMADPWNGSRTLAALLAAVIVGAGVYGVRAQFLIDAGADGDYSSPRRDFYTGTFTLISLTVDLVMAVAAAGVLIALAEGIVTRRRGYAALVATGVPRRTLGEAIAWQTLAPLVPATVVALIVGIGLIRAPSAAASGIGMREAPVPLADLVLLGAGAFAIMVLVVGAGLLFLRMSTDLDELRVG